MGCLLLDSEYFADLARESFYFIHPENSNALDRLIKKENFAFLAALREKYLELIQKNVNI
jgi:hypothetical protein